MKTVNDSSVLGVMNLFSSEEYYKYAIEVLCTLRNIVLEEIKVEYGPGRGMSYNTKHPKFWIAEVTNGIIGRALIEDYTYSTILGNVWLVGNPRNHESGFLTYDEAKFIAGIMNKANLMDELYRLRDSAIHYANDKSNPSYNIYKVTNDLIEAFNGRKLLCA